jgi:DNA-binding response OmpR family regulator
MKQQPKVLIVDDDTWLSDTFSTVLTAHEWQVRVCHDAHVAIDVVDEWLPSVVLLDILLPHASGIGLIHELQSYDDTKDVPVVLCSSLAVDIPLDEYGVYAVLDKTTMTPELLLETLKGALRANTKD